MWRLGGLPSKDVVSPILALISKLAQHLWKTPQYLPLLVLSRFEQNILFAILCFYQVELSQKYTFYEQSHFQTAILLSLHCCPTFGVSNSIVHCSQQMHQLTSSKKNKTAVVQYPHALMLPSTGQVLATLTHSSTFVCSCSYLWPRDGVTASLLNPQPFLVPLA